MFPKISNGEKVMDRICDLYFLSATTMQTR